MTMNQTLSTATRVYQGQSLVPQLQKSLELLTATAPELRGILEQELQQNPTLEEIEQIDALNSNPSDPGDPPEDVLVTSSDSTGADLFERILSRGADQEALQERHQLLLNNLVSPTSITEDLLSQARQANSKQYALLEFIIGNLDEHGYLSVTLEGQEFEAALALVQSFDPPGIAARNLQECLLLQLRRKVPVNELTVQIVRDQFDLLAKRRFKSIENILQRDISQALLEIQGLRPYPISDLPAAAEITPEVSININGEVALKQDSVPRLRISPLSVRLLADPATPKETLDYLREKIRSGKFILRSMAERQKTIEKVVREIFCRRQRKFLEYGPGHLLPMTMAEVAAAVDLHETTISRTVNGKYIDTPYGVYELKHFFTSGIQSGSSGLVSSQNVKLLLRELISKEDHPLSDEELVALFKEKNIHIARRTVAKYREQLKILPSYLRK